MYILVVILLLISGYSVFFIHQFINIIFKGYAPLVSTDKGTITTIIEALDIKKDPIVYELGCGQAKFLKTVEQLFPSTKLIGIENLTIIFLLNRLKLGLSDSKIKLILADFFKVNLKEADIIYCYLNNETMKCLGDKFKQESKKGTQIISRSFPIPQFSPERVITIKNKTVYFYQI